MRHARTKSVRRRHACARAERGLPGGLDSDRVVDLDGHTALGQLADVLAGADAVVVGYTGPAHLAAAVGTPVVSLFAPTVPPVRWRPHGVPHRLLMLDVPCAGCRAHACPIPEHPSMTGITPDEVVDALDGLLHAYTPVTRQVTDDVRDSEPAAHAKVRA